MSLRNDIEQILQQAADEAVNQGRAVEREAQPLCYRCGGPAPCSCGE